MEFRQGRPSPNVIQMVLKQIYPSEYRTWKHMLYRCCNHRCKEYRYYGGRGITVCDRWKWGFLNFINDMGKKPFPDDSLDRINNDGNYEPNNCRWASKTEQNRNVRSNRLLTFNGKTQCLSAWAKEVGMERTKLTARLNRGWSIEKALTAPADRRGRFAKSK